MVGSLNLSLCTKKKYVVKLNIFIIGIIVALNKKNSELNLNKLSKINENCTVLSENITICIPTFNRGKKALENLHKMLNISSAFFGEFLILDNNSTKQKKEYLNIKKISQENKKIKYIKKKENTGFGGNLLDCFIFSETKYIIIVSDEDMIDLKEIPKIINLLNKNPNLLAIRSSIQGQGGEFKGNSYIFPNELLIDVEDRFKKFSIFNNYISGSLYNRDVVVGKGLIDRIRNKIHKHIDYPHIYLDVLLSSLGPVANSPIVLVLEGDNDSYQSEVEYTNAYQLGRRIDQFIHLRDALYESIEMLGKPFNELLFLNCYILLCQKYTRQICIINRELFIHNKIDLKYLNMSLLPFFISAICKYNWYRKYENQIHIHLRESIKRFKVD